MSGKWWKQRALWQVQFQKEVVSFNDHRLHCVKLCAIVVVVIAVVSLHKNTTSYFLGNHEISQKNTTAIVL